MTTTPPGCAQFIPRGQDRFAAHRSLGITRVTFTVASADTEGRLFVTEQTMLAKGGPPRHLHLEQEEWFYSLDGTFILEVGPDRFILNPGDSAFAPRRIPHVWAYVGTGPGRLLIAFTPAGQMEAFFQAVATTNAMPTQDPALWPPMGWRSWVPHSR